MTATGDAIWRAFPAAVCTERFPMPAFIYDLMTHHPAQPVVFPPAFLSQPVARVSTLLSRDGWSIFLAGRHNWVLRGPQGQKARLFKPQSDGPWLFAGPRNLSALLSHISGESL